MKPIKSKYIHFLQKNITTRVGSWYTRHAISDALADKKTWRKVRLIPGKSLKDIGYNIPEEQYIDFFCVEDNQIVEDDLHSIIIYDAAISED